MRSSFLAIAIGLSVAGFASNAFGADVTPEPEPVLLNDMYAEIFGSYTELGKDFGTEDDKFWAGGAGIYWSIPLSDMVSLQLDGKGEVTENDGEDEDTTDYEYSVGGAAHLSYRDPQSFLVGIFGGLSNAAGGENGDTTAYFIGGEGQLYVDQATFYVQGGYLDGEGDDFDEQILNDTYFVRGQLRYYLTDNFRATVEGAYAVGQVDLEDNTDIYDWGAELEYKFDDAPISVFASYEGTFMDQTPGEEDKLSEDVYTVGLRLDFGTTTIIERDRQGAGLDMPRIGRWQGEAGGPLE
jgi:hypothetical protein